MRRSISDDLLEVLKIAILVIAGLLIIKALISAFWFCLIFVEIARWCSDLIVSKSLSTDFFAKKKIIAISIFEINLSLTILISN